MSKAQFLKENLKPDEIYAGLVLGVKGQPDGHLVLLPGHASKLNWEAAIQWAESKGGRLPTRQEQSIIFANCKPHLRPTWHWSCESHDKDASFAWHCGFSTGYQDYNHKSYEGEAVAVRLIHLAA